MSQVASMSNRGLYAVMIERADYDKLPEEHVLRTQAEEFRQAITDYYGNPQKIDSKKFVGLWAKTRRVWCEYSGERLI